MLFKFSVFPGKWVSAIGLTSLPKLLGACGFVFLIFDVILFIVSSTSKNPPSLNMCSVNLTNYTLSVQYVQSYSNLKWSIEDVHCYMYICIRLHMTFDIPVYTWKRLTWIVQLVCLNCTDLRNQCTFALIRIFYIRMRMNFAGIKSTKDYFQTFFKSEKASYFIIR